MILLTCRRCKGTGEIPNEQYEICMALRSDEAKRYFRMHMNHEDKDGNDIPDGCEMVQSVPCPDCDGAGRLSFDEEEWELRVVEEGESGE
ncbi:MAG: hypothetical protein LUQ25_09345 [Methanoregulaceae archaeon]|nr:hypothetical protein [Methanoregulaceae archaeon]